MTRPHPLPFLTTESAMSVQHAQRKRSVAQLLARTLPLKSP